MKSIYRIASRQSPLALWQTHWVISQLHQYFPNLSFEIVPCLTQGDQTTDRATMRGKDLFVKDLQKKILKKDVDMAVHSCKDMSVHEPEELIIAAFCKRADPRDAFVSKRFNSLNHLPVSAKVGTSSPRRQCQLKAYRPDLTILPLHGNVGTRLEKLIRGEYDAIILAAAGLQRLNLIDSIQEYLNPEIFIPAIGQGIIAVECRKDDKNLIEMLQQIDHPVTRCCAIAERAVNQQLGGDCYTPLAAHAYLNEDQLFLQAMLGIENTNKIIHSKIQGPATTAKELGFELANKIMAIKSNGDAKFINEN